MTSSHQYIVDGLRATTARIVADRTSLTSPAGQTALITLYGQLATMGLQIDIDVPEVDLFEPQPPVHGDRLVSRLCDYAADLLPGGSSCPSTSADVAFVVGNSTAANNAVRVSGGPWHAYVGGHSPLTPSPGVATYRSGQWRPLQPQHPKAPCRAATHRRTPRSARTR